MVPRAKKYTEPVTPSSDLPSNPCRSKCRLGGHQPRALRSRCTRESSRRQRGRQARLDEICRKLRLSLFPSQFTAEFPGPRRNAPSRCRPRPAPRLTAAEATAYRGAINLGRSVLGAIATLGGEGWSVKWGLDRKRCCLRTFLHEQVELGDLATCSSVLRKKRDGPEGPSAEFAEPGALSSTTPGDLPLPRTASR